MLTMMTILPRQARDKHRESTQKQTVLSGAAIWHPHRAQVREAHEISLAMPFYRLKVIVLPRQARDNHRERTQKREMLFFAYRQKVWPALRHADRKREGARLANKRFYTELVEVRRKNVFLLPVLYSKPKTFAKVGSGQTQGKLRNKTPVFLQEYEAVGSTNTEQWEIKEQIKVQKTPVLSHFDAKNVRFAKARQARDTEHRKS
jgi:hypothetical protein